MYFLGAIPPDIIAAAAWSNIGWAVAIFVATFVVSIAVVAAILIWLPATFFLDSHNRDLWVDHHPVVRWAGKIMKNLLGACLIVVGTMLSLPGIPGQGLLTILIGLLLIDFPGKRKLERRIIMRPAIRKRVDRLRERFGKSPLVLDDTDGERQV